MTSLPPLSLYVHIPWCVKKCPYCDFNSHESRQIPEQAYLEALLEDMQQSQDLAQGRALQSIFFGGGTPSLFKAETIGAIIDAARTAFGFKPSIEITLEANPGATEYSNLSSLKRSGVNRLSFGVQSFNDQHLRNLGRIHSAGEAQKAFESARKAGFLNINIDLMHGLQNQTPQQAIDDLNIAIKLAPEHISWYQLTIEPNTVFYKSPPLIPKDETLADIQDAGLSFLEAHGYGRYEISAFARHEKQSQHNLNYWQFGDYLALGAGAHGKISFPNGQIKRYWKTRLPDDYLAKNKDFTAGSKNIDENERPLEFLMNALRLNQGFSPEVFETRVGLGINSIQSQLQILTQRGLIFQTEDQIACTPLGYEFLNSVLDEFV